MPAQHADSTVFGGGHPGVCWLTQAQPVERVGVKFHSLSRLFGRGLPVPLAFCVPLEVLSHDRGQAIVERAARRLARISGAGLFAVRSSSVDEDDASGSRAGHYDTELSVEPADVWAAVRRCAYPPAHSPIPIMVQAMIEPLQSGVLFTQHPLIAAAGTVLVEAVAGTAEQLVGGGQSASGRYVFLPADGWHTEEGGGLSDDSLDALLRFGVNCEQIQGCGRDIEWWTLRAGSGSSSPGRSRRCRQDW